MSIHDREKVESPKRCAGCGVTLQTTDKLKVGSVPEAALSQEQVTCQRCFRIKNYNEAAAVAIDNDEFLRLLGGIAHTDSLVVHIVDLFDFEGSLISGLQRFVGGNPVLLVVNKIDLLPKGTNTTEFATGYSVMQRQKDCVLWTSCCAARREIWASSMLWRQSVNSAKDVTST